MLLCCAVLCCAAIEGSIGACCTPHRDCGDCGATGWPEQPPTATMVWSFKKTTTWQQSSSNKESYVRASTASSFRAERPIPYRHSVTNPTHSQECVPAACPLSLPASLPSAWFRRSSPASHKRKAARHDHYLLHAHTGAPACCCAVITSGTRFRRPGGVAAPPPDMCTVHDMHVCVRARARL